MKRSTKQTDLVLAQLRDGSAVTKLTAVHNGIENLGDVVMRLRRKGINIRTLHGTDMNGARYVKYKLAPRLQVEHA